MDGADLLIETEAGLAARDALPSRMRKPWREPSDRDRAGHELFIGWQLRRAATWPDFVADGRTLSG